MDLKNSILIIIIIILIISISYFFYRTKTKEIALTVFSIVSTLFVAEIITKLFYPQIMEHDELFEYDANLGWKFMANNKVSINYEGEANHYVETNSLGFRDGPYLLNQDNTKKILVLGDSFVSNVSVKSEDVFTEVLQDRLENIEVLNFGINGYSQVQEYLQLKEWYHRINPDVIILMVYIRNDFANNIDENGFVPRPFASWDEENQTIKINHPTPRKETTEKVTSVPFWRIYRKSHLYHLLSNRINFLRIKLNQDNEPELIPSLQDPPELYLCNTQPSENTKLMQRTMEELLLKFAAFSDEIGVPLVFAIAPSMVQVEDKLWSSFLENYGGNSRDFIRSLPNDRLIQFAEDNKLQMIDLLPILRSEANKGKVLYYPKEQHWNSEGNQVVARSLYDYLETRSLID